MDRGENITPTLQSQLLSVTASFWTLNIKEQTSRDCTELGGDTSTNRTDAQYINRRITDRVQCKKYRQRIQLLQGKCPERN